MKALITGAAGFVGSHLAGHLLAGGHTVAGVDDVSTGRLDNLDPVLDHPRFRFVRGTVLDSDLVDAQIAECDAVFHLAAAVGAFVIRDRTLQSLLTNIHGTENVLRSADRHGAAVLLASTSEIYGKNDKVGLREDDDRVTGSPLRSRWSYSEAKAVDESLTEAYVRERGLRAVIVRLFNTVGPRQSGRYGMVLPRFVEQALHGDPLTVFGTGRQVRCFCHVLDVVPALADLIDCPEAFGTAVNLGSQEQVSIEELARRVIAATGSTSRISYASYESAYGSGYEDMQSRVPDCTRARDLVGFDAVRSLDEIIRSVVDEHTGERHASTHAAL